MKNPQIHGNSPYCDTVTGSSHQDQRRSSPWQGQASFMALSMLFFLSIVSSLSMLILLWNFSISYHNSALLVDMHLNEMNKNETKLAIPIDEMNPVSVAPPFEGINSSLPTSTSTEAVKSTNPQIPVKRDNPIAILNEKHHPPPTYSCAIVCNAPSIIGTKIKVILSAEGENHLLLETRVQTEDKRVAKRKAAYQALGHLYKEELARSTIDPEWDLTPVSCEATQIPGNVTWDEKCK